MVSALVVAQIKFVVYKSDGSKIMLLANEVDSMGFEGTNVETEDNEDEEDNLCGFSVNGTVVFMRLQR